MDKLTAFSYSRLTGFETCPKKFYALTVAKSVKDPPNEYTSYGTEVHLAFATYLKTGKALPLHLRQYTPWLAQIKASPGEHIIEQKVAINANYAPTEWYADDVYCRVISDLTILNGSKAAMFDWKTGKMSDDFIQLRLAAAVIFLLAQEIETIDMAYVWTKTRKITKQSMTREEMPGLWAEILPRVRHYQEAHDTMSFPARPGDHCRYCPVKTCPHNTSKS